LVWHIEFKESARKALLKLDKRTQEKIVDFLVQRVQPADNPRFSGKPLQGHLKNFWRYRVGDYRLICEIQDEHLAVMVIKLGHRREIYR